MHLYVYMCIDTKWQESTRLTTHPSIRDDPCPQNHSFAFCLDYMICQKSFRCNVWRKAGPNGAGALSMRLGPVIEWGRRIRGEGGLSEGNPQLEVDMYLQPGYIGETLLHIHGGLGGLVHKGNPSYIWVSWGGISPPGGCSLLTLKDEWTSAEVLSKEALAGWLVRSQPGGFLLEADMTFGQVHSGG